MEDVCDPTDVVDVGVGQDDGFEAALADSFAHYSAEICEVLRLPLSRINEQSLMSTSHNIGVRPVQSEAVWTLLGRVHAQDGIDQRGKATLRH